MKPDLSDKALKKQHNNEEIIKQTAEQIIKDFAVFGIDIFFPVEMTYAYSELYEQLHGHISEMWNSNNNKLVSILYRIDLPEKNIRKKKEEFPDIPVSHIITDLVIERELKKVLTRHFFSHSLNKPSTDTTHSG